MDNKNKGFTLAEVLITLAIIGVVAAMTIPVLMNKTGDLQLKTAWKKSYSGIANAVNLITQDNGGSLIGVFNYNATPPDDTRSLFGKYLHFNATGVYSATNEVCWPKTIYELNGAEITQSSPQECARLSDGTLIQFSWTFDSNCNNSTSYHPSGNCQALMVDVNGFKKPNTLGKDIFSIWVEKNRILPYGVDGDQAPFNECLTLGYGCSAKYLYE